MKNEVTPEWFFKEPLHVFKACSVPFRQPDYTSYNKRGRVSSQYWFGTNKSMGDYVIRRSAHWSKFQSYSLPMLQFKFNACGKIKKSYWILRLNSAKDNETVFRDHNDRLISAYTGKAYRQDEKKPSYVLPSEKN
jgi:DNA-directed RNA polymerase subunit M/transcription elongation factor TFIIS